MDFIYVGDIVNTHGLKGEIRITSDFKFKKTAFEIGRKCYIGKEHKEEIIDTYRTHKTFDMVTFKDKKHIDDVIIYKNEPMYVNRADITYDGYLDEDLIGLEVYCEGRHIGCVESIMKNTAHEILLVKNGSKHMIPNVDEFVKKVDLENKILEINYMKGLLNED